MLRDSREAWTNNDHLKHAGIKRLEDKNCNIIKVP